MKTSRPRSISNLVLFGILTIIALVVGLELHSEASRRGREVDAIAQKARESGAKLEAFPYDAYGRVPAELRYEHEQLLSAIRDVQLLRDMRKTQSNERNASIAALLIAFVLGFLTVRELRRPKRGTAKSPVLQPASTHSV